MNDSSNCFRKGRMFHAALVVHDIAATQPVACSAGLIGWRKRSKHAKKEPEMLLFTSLENAT